MTQPSSPQNHLPPGPDFLIRRIQDLERRVNLVEGRRTLTNASIDSGSLTIQGGSLFVKDADGNIIDILDANGITVQGKSVTVTETGSVIVEGGGNISVDDGGDIVLNDGGNLSLKTAAGKLVVYAGQSDIPDGSGRTQQIFELGRDDGSIAFALADLGTIPNHPHQQNWALYDRAGNLVVTEDTVSGKGLAKPYLGGGLQMVNTDTSKWWATTATTWTSIATGYFRVQNPLIQLVLWMQVDGATTGQFRVLVNGSQIGATQTVTGAFAAWDARGIGLPAGVNVGDRVTVEVDAQVTSGTGVARAMFLHFAGDQS